MVKYDAIMNSLKIRYIGYNGIHEFVIESVDENLIRFRQIEKLEGPIVLFMNNMIYKTAIGYVKMNEEFKGFLERDKELITCQYTQ